MVKNAEVVPDRVPAGSLAEDPLAPEPAPTGVLIGYARVSTGGQRLDRQMAALEAAGCVRVFADKQSGKNAERAQLQAALDYMRPGDTLVVPSLDRLGRSLQDLIAIVADLRRRGIGFRSLHEALDTTTPGGRLVFHVFAALAEFIRELIVQGTNEGLAAARARGQRLGRPPALTPEQVRQARALLARPEESVSSIARLLGVSRSTLYKYVPEAKGGGRTLQPAGEDAAGPVAGTPASPAATVGRDETPDPVTETGVQEAEETEEAAFDEHQEHERQEHKDQVPKDQGPEEAAGPAVRGWPCPDLGPQWSMTGQSGESARTLWHQDVRVGAVERAWPGSGWVARPALGGLIVAGGDRRGRHPSRIKALTALAAAFEQRRREHTPHAEAAVDGLPDGWRLTQTQAEHDEGVWTLHAPGGQIAGRITRVTYGRRPQWRATTGDPADRHYLPTTITAERGDPARGSDSDLWRTRTTAAHALAQWHDPNLPGS